MRGSDDKEKQLVIRFAGEFMDARVEQAQRFVEAVAVASQVSIHKDKIFWSARNINGKRSLMYDSAG